MGLPTSAVSLLSPVELLSLKYREYLGCCARLRVLIPLLVSIFIQGELRYQSCILNDTALGYLVAIRCLEEIG